MNSYLRRQGKSSCPNRNGVKEKKKKRKGNKPNASVALTCNELDTHYEKGLLVT